MYCPKCKYEYRDGITQCPDCHSSLVDSLEEEDEIRNDAMPCKVYTAADEFEADIIVSKLRSEGIYAYKKYRSTDEYSRIILGRTMFGVDVFVADFDSGEAFRVIKS